jgi:DNA-binding transcriptional ArsR family regulator
MLDPAATANLLGDPTRVRVIDALTRGPRRTAELAAVTGMSAAALSRHLKLLREAGIVARSDVEGDGRGRVYELRPGALDNLAGWLRSANWAAELAAASGHPPTRELLARMGGFLDAFASCDRTFFERHLRADAVLVFPGAAHPIDRQGCLDSVRAHPPYLRYAILGEPIVRVLGARTSVLTLRADVATAADENARPMFITAVIDDGDPWQLAHLQWTPAAISDQKGSSYE